MCFFSDEQKTSSRKNFFFISLACIFVCWILSLSLFFWQSKIEPKAKKNCAKPTTELMWLYHHHHHFFILILTITFSFFVCFCFFQSYHMIWWWSIKFSRSIPKLTTFHLFFFFDQLSKKSNSKQKQNSIHKGSSSTTTRFFFRNQNLSMCMCGWVDRWCENQLNLMKRKKNIEKITW